MLLCVMMVQGCISTTYSFYINLPICHLFDYLHNLVLIFLSFNFDKLCIQWPAGNQIAKRVFDDLVDFSRETSVARCMKFFFEQQIFDRLRFINRMHEELHTSTNLLGQLTALIPELEAFPDLGEVFDTLMYLRDDVRDEQARVDALYDCITRAKEQIEIKDEHVIYVCGPCYVELWKLYGWVSIGVNTMLFQSFNMLSILVFDVPLLLVTGSPRLGAKMKCVFGRSRTEDESLGSLMCSLCSGLRVSLSNKRRLVAELEALGELEGIVQCLEHLRVIFAHDAVTLRELETLLARAQVGAALKTSFVADMEVQE
ncbi:hypothetical protein Tco_1458206 [Tanacetum coccineum]